MNRENDSTDGDQAKLTCGSCGTEFPTENAGKVNVEGQPLCIPCSLKITSASATSTTKESQEQQQARVEAAAEKREKEKGSRRLVAVLLLIAIPVIALEVFLLLNNRPAEFTAAEAAEIELSEYMVMRTILGQYYDDQGEYPQQLTSLVPDYWSSSNTADLEHYQYSRVSSESYRLEKTGSLLPAPLISEAVSQDLMPASMTTETNVDSYFDRIDEGRQGGLP